MWLGDVLLTFTSSTVLMSAYANGVGESNALDGRLLDIPYLQDIIAHNINPPCVSAQNLTMRSAGSGAPVICWGLRFLAVALRKDPHTCYWAVHQPITAPLHCVAMLGAASDKLQGPIPGVGSVPERRLPWYPCYPHSARRKTPLPQGCA